MHKPTFYCYQNLGKNQNPGLEPRFSQSDLKHMFCKKCDEKNIGFVLNTVFMSQIINCVTKKSRNHSSENLQRFIVNGWLKKLPIVVIQDYCTPNGSAPIILQSWGESYIKSQVGHHH